MMSHKLAQAITFFIVANPAVYVATRGVLGSWVATPEGTAKTGGLVLHAIVFVLLYMLICKLLKKVSYQKSYEKVKPM
jgi:hypothetical protein